MKKLLYILISISLFAESKSQVVFCPPGAEWHYNFVQYFGYAMMNEKITYAGDVVVAGETVKQLNHSRFFTRDNNGTYTFITYLKQSGDTIFMKNIRTANAWQVLYNFNCQPGQGWSNVLSDHTNTLINNYVKVDSVDYVTINGQSLKRLFAKYNNTNSVQIIERIGCNNFLFNYRCHPTQSDDDQLVDFLCYTDNTFGQKQFTSKPCDFVDYVGLFEENPESGVNVYPNPVSSKLTIQLSGTQMKGLSISNYLGETIYEEVQNSNQELDLSFLSGGIYYFKYFD